MSAEVALSVRGLGKDYTIRHQPRSASLAEQVTTSLKRRMGRLRSDGTTEIFSALRDVSFDVAKGDVIGIIGRNGAGKSTLLKVLSRITEPTRGEVQVYGRIGALLEVGAGFHPELTGRENVFLNGAILGMSRREVVRLFDEIVDFAEVERFIDTPVKRYSSGMYVRLAFAVAAFVLPEILIVDEVIAVGDTAFQKKCIGRMSDAASAGRTVIFVSHNMQVVNSLCTTAVLLERGVVTKIGAVADCVGAYQASLGGGRAQRTTFEPMFDDLGLLAVHVDQDSDAAVLLSTLPITVSMTARLRGLTVKEVTAGFALHDAYGTSVLSTYFDDLDDRPPDEWLDGDYELRCTIPANTLNEGQHRLRFNVSQAKVRRAVRDEEHVIDFEVVNVDGVGSHWGSGPAWRPEPMLPAFPWSLRRAQPDGMLDA